MLTALQGSNQNDQPSRSLRSHQKPFVQHDGSRAQIGSKRSDRSQIMEESTRWNQQAKMELHITGRMYEDAVATPYNSDNLLNRDTLWFEQGIYVPVQDCLGHAINYLFNDPIFTDREQLFNLAL